MTDSALIVERVTVRFGARRVLDEVSFRLEPGEFTGLIGSNGAGKTTLFRVILGRQQTDQGEVSTDARIGYVPQKFLLDRDLPLRGRDLVALGIDGHRFGPRRPSKQRRATVERLLAAVDATHFADARIGRLSGGEQQRILIAHALAARPQLLLLDEPLANLDLRAGRETVSLLSRIAREQGIAILISAHELNALLPAMDRVVYLAAGRAATGTADEVVSTEVLSRLYGHHVDVLRVHGRVIVVAGEPLSDQSAHVELV
jgi:zinc/manganese transport system ATP-binding protein